jgi:hypothetical protein
MAKNEHLSERLLESALDKGLGPERFDEILKHLSACPRCEQQMERMESALSPYLHFREHVAPMFPQPSKPWANIWDEMGRVEPRRVRAPATARPIWAGAMAAVIVLVALFWPRPDASLHAETLLQRAKVSVAHSPAQARRRLRVRTQAGSFIRPAVLLTSIAEDSLASRIGGDFWRDPLSPAAFAEWRDSRKHKTDVVLEAASEYTIRTSTPDGELQEASLTIEAPAMLPVGARFVFANRDWIEISALPEVAAPLESDLRASAARSPIPSAGEPERSEPVSGEIELASRELRVRAAIDALNLQAGDPIGLEADDRSQIVVTAYALGSQDLSRLRGSVQGIEGVAVRVEEATPKTAVDTDPVIDASEALLSQAHLLSQIAERFAPATVARLHPEDRRSLWTLREHQAAEMNHRIDLLYQQLGKPVPDTAPLDVDSAAGLLESAATVDRLVTNIYAGGGTHRDSGPELFLELSHLKQLAQAYSNYVARSLETLR